MTSSTSTDKYAHEEVASTYGYPSGYSPKDLVPQSNTLRGLFSGAGFFDQDYLARVQRGQVALLSNAEGWFAIPRWQNLAGTYNAAVEAVLAKLAETRPFTNWREGQLGPDRLRKSERTSHALDIVAEQQKGADILIVPAQFGKRHAGRSVRRAREVFAPNEFGLGAYEVACMLLTHAERLRAFEDLWIDCPGDEYSDAGRFDSAPAFRFRDGRLEFDAYWSDYAHASYGSASGFLPQ